MTSDSFFKVLGFLIKVVLGLCGGFVALVVLSFFTNPRGYKSKAYGQFTACKSNCKNIATALEMYASDHKGRYPRRLEQLEGGIYLKTLPTCPAAGRMTYENYRVSTRPDAFSFACCGTNHSSAQAGANLPRYSAELGLVEH
ncbi:MAG: hypothetical protein J0I12_06930 [Candidatus Eremiobacteraeota bacterium]|nr:hypothetical protein [Candidatus Eremiobacteraeota bacterium]